MSAFPRLPAAAQPQATALAPVASLAMYDWPELEAANDALWSALAQRLAAHGLEAVPPRLTRGQDLDVVWTSPALLLGQACGYPLVTRLAGRVQLVATPRYRAPGCEGPFRRSAIVVAAGSPATRLADLQGACCALNDPASDSGMNLLRAAIAPLARGSAFFAEVRVTGSHLASAEAIAAGHADVAALDAVSYAHLRRHRPHVARGLRVLTWTARSPGLPLVTAVGATAAAVQTLQDALAEVGRDPQLAGARETLLIDGFSHLPLHHYRQTLYLEERARALGYGDLR